MATALVLVRNTVTHDSRVLRAAGVLRELGFEVLVVGIASREEQRRELEIEGFPVVRLLGPRGLVRRLLHRDERERPAARPAGGGSGGPVSRAGGLRRLAITLAFTVQGIALVLRRPPALVHANDYPTMWIALAAKLLRGSRVVYDAHELWPDQDGEFGRRPWLLACEWLFVRAADANITVSPGCAEVMAARFRIPPPVVVRNLPERRTADTQPNTEGLRAGGRPIAVYVGLLAPHRGLEQAVDALPAIPELLLRLIGPDSEGFAAELERRAREAGAADRVELRPPVPPLAVAESIAGADMGLVLIQPTSLSHRMSLPNKLFEYVAAGLPVVATDLPVLGQLVREEKIGEVVPPGDAAALAGALERLSQPAYNHEVRERVHALANQATWERERLVLAEVYTSLVAAPHPLNPCGIEPGRG